MEASFNSQSRMIVTFVRSIYGERNSTQMERWIFVSKVALTTKESEEELSLRALAERQAKRKGLSASRVIEG